MKEGRNLGRNLYDLPFSLYRMKKKKPKPELVCPFPSNANCNLLVLI